MLIELSDTSIQAALRYFEGLFESGNAEALLDSFTDDVEVQYASFAPFKGKEKLRQMLERRFATMQEYRLQKQLEFFCSSKIASSWTGSWLDLRVNSRMRCRGIEILTLRDGHICHWTAAVTAWQSDESTSV